MPGVVTNLDEASEMRTYSTRIIYKVYIFACHCLNKFTLYFADDMEPSLCREYRYEQTFEAILKIGNPVFSIGFIFSPETEA